MGGGRFIMTGACSGLMYTYLMLFTTLFYIRKVLMLINELVNWKNCLSWYRTSSVFPLPRIQTIMIDCLVYKECSVFTYYSRSLIFSIWLWIIHLRVKRDFICTNYNAMCWCIIISCKYILNSLIWLYGNLYMVIIIA